MTCLLWENYNLISNFKVQISNKIQFKAFKKGLNAKPEARRFPTGVNEAYDRTLWTVVIGCQ
jgi:hypothetical protein